MSKHLLDGQALGLGWGKTLRASLEGGKQRPPCEVSIVSLFGGLPRSETTNPYDVAAVFLPDVSMLRNVTILRHPCMLLTLNEAED